MVEFSKAAVHDIYESGEVKEVEIFDIINANCVFEHNKTFYFTSQTIESKGLDGTDSSLVIHTVNGADHGRIICQFSDDDAILDFGFLKDNIMIVLYNSNVNPDSGVFLFNISNYDYKGEVTYHDKGDECQRLTLQGENDPDIFDGRMIIDKILHTLTVTCIVSYILVNNLEPNQGLLACRVKWSLSVKPY